MPTSDYTPVFLLEVAPASAARYDGEIRFSGDMSEACFLSVRDLPLSLGRRPDNTVVLYDPNVSRHSFDIDGSVGQLRVTGITQRNGLLLNNRRIEGSCDLRFGDVIGFAESDIRMRVCPPDTASSFP